MEKADIILISGIVLAGIFLLVCVLLKPKNRKYAYLAGGMIDLLLLAYTGNSAMFFAGAAGGIIVGLFSCSLNVRKYRDAVRELGSVGDYIIACTIFCTMIFMTMAAAGPDVTFTWT